MIKDPAEQAIPLRHSHAETGALLRIIGLQLVGPLQVVTRDMDLVQTRTYHESEEV